MAKISNVRTVPERAPVDQMKDDPNRVEREVDALGRSIGVRKLTFIDVFEITCLMGDDSSNGPALNQAITAASVCEIDGAPVARVTSRAMLKAQMTRLDFAGIAAALKAMAKFSPSGEEASDEDDAVKN